jgi:hypothetical protein
MLLLLGLREEHGDELVAALADLTARLLECHVMTEFDQCLLPRARVQVDGIDQRPIDVEDGSFGHGCPRKGVSRQRGLMATG